MSDDAARCDRCGAESDGPWSWYVGPDWPRRGAALYAAVCPVCRAALLEEPAEGRVDPDEADVGRSAAASWGRSPADPDSTPIDGETDG